MSRWRTLKEKINGGYFFQFEEEHHQLLYLHEAIQGEICGITVKD